jgi:hypothetical protein
MVVLVSGPDADWEKMASLAKQTTASIKFIDYDASKDVIDWYRLLAGKRLSLRGSSDDSSRREDLYFCRDGGFEHRITRSGSKDSGTGTSFGFSAKNKSGLWTVAYDDGTSRLVLRYSDGPEMSATIEDRNGRIFVNGQRYYIMRNNRCR